MTEAEILDNAEEVKNIDRGGMLAAVGQMPEMLLQAQQFVAGINFSRPKKLNQSVILGMGGSAIAGDIAAGLFLKKAKAPILMVRDYILPGYVGQETLLFALSYSGDTEEILSAVKEAGKRQVSVICIASGGKLRELAQSKNYPCILIPSGHQPRAALPYLLVPVLLCLERTGMANLISEEIKEAAALLQKLREEYGPDKPLRSNPVKQLAKKLVGKMPLISGATGTTAAAALRLKTQFSENSKVTALLSLFPELNHNDMVNLSILKRGTHNFAWIVLRDEGDGERIKKRIEITKSLIGHQLGGANEIFSQGKSPLARMMSLIFFGDYLSVYLAILQGIDPTSVEVISRLKKELMR